MCTPILNSITQNGRTLLIIGLTLLLVGCGGGGGSGGGENNSPITTSPAQTLTANAGADRTVNAGEIVELKASGTGTITGYSWTRTDGPNIALTAVDINTGWFTFIAPPTGTEKSITVTYQLTVSGNGNTAQDSVTFTILRVNKAPTISAGKEKTVKGKESVVLQANGSDTDGTIITYSWEQIAGDKVTLNNAHTAQPSFTAPSTLQDVMLRFRLTVTDNDGATAQAEVNVQVTPENAPQITFHFPPLQGVYTGSSIAAFGIANAANTNVVSVTLDAGAGPVTAILGNDGKWRADNIPVPTGVTAFELVAKVTDSLNRESSTKSQLKTSGYDTGTGPTWKSTVALAIEPNANKAYVLTAGNTVDDVNLLPIDLTTGERGPVLSAWSDKAQGTQLTLLSHMIYHTENKQFYALTDNANDAGARALISINPLTGAREIVSSASRGTGDAFEYAVALAQGPGNSVFVSDNKAAKIFKIDTTTGDRTTLVSQTTANHNLQGLINLVWNNQNTKDLYVVINNFYGSILKLDLNSAPINSNLLSQSSINEVGTGPNIGNAASDIVLDLINNRAFVLQNDLDGVIEVNLSNGNRREIIKNATGSMDRKKGMAFDADKQLLYTAGGFVSANMLTVIDVQSGNKVILSR